MVHNQIADRGVHSPLVLQAMTEVPRHNFLPKELAHRAYHDSPLPIGLGATISQPYIVAAMIEAAGVEPGHRVLDVGTGSGYQAAVLAQMGADVWTVERVPTLVDGARRALAPWPSVRLHHADGYVGLPNAAPFDAILVAAAAPRVPDSLLDQLAPNGRLVLPVGDDLNQELLLFEHRFGRFDRKLLMAVMFVDLVPGLAPTGLR
jgi:protein-L-isoaspartate(D-aspartate) O-methyltransferase